MSEFRGLDYNSIKSEYVGKTPKELEEQIYVNAFRVAQAQKTNDVFAQVECLARIALISEISEEQNK